MLVEFEKDLKEIVVNERRIKKHLKSKNYSKKILNKISKKIDKYDAKIKLLDNIKYIGHKILRIRFDANKFNNNTLYTRQKIQKISNDLSQLLYRKGIAGKLLTSINFPDLGWRSGYFSTIGDNVRLYVPQDSDIVADDPDYFNNFVVYISLAPGNAGGNDKFNDCLYNCLYYYLYDKLPWDTPIKFKKFLNIPRNDKVPITLISKIEDKLKTFAINIRGDYVYSSTIKSSKQINLLLENEHYLIDKTIPMNRNINYRVSYEEKQPVLYDKLSFEMYDGIEKQKISKKELNDILYNYKSKYILIDREEKKGNLSIEEEYRLLIQDIDIIKKSTNGIINLRKTGNIKDTSLDLFDKFTKFLKHPEIILQDEAEWISNTNTGAIIYAESYNGPGYKYDIRSMYPSIMISSGKFPIGRGEFNKLDNFDNLSYFQFGIYRCKIIQENDNDNKLFRFNPKNYYTHTSLEHAKSLGFKIELILDNEPNFLYYSREKLIGFNEVFHKYIDFVFDLKQKKIPKSKDILNRLWGVLSEIDRKKYFCCSDNETILSPDDEIISLRPYKLNDDIDIMECVSKKNYYKTSFARLSPFLISRGRFNISNIIMPHKNNVHRIHTDGFISDIKLDIKLGENLGDLVFEGYCENCNIINCSNNSGEFNI
jgi:hypothetical protein